MSSPERALRPGLERIAVASVEALARECGAAIPRHSRAATPSLPGEAYKDFCLILKVHPAMAIVALRPPGPGLAATV